MKFSGCFVFLSACRFVLIYHRGKKKKKNKHQKTCRKIPAISPKFGWVGERSSYPDRVLSGLKIKVQNELMKPRFSFLETEKHKSQVGKQIELIRAGKYWTYSFSQPPSHPALRTRKRKCKISPMTLDKCRLFITVVHLITEQFL